MVVTTTVTVGFTVFRFSAVRATRFGILGGSDACEQNVKDEEHEGETISSRTN